MPSIYGENSPQSLSFDPSFVHQTLGWSTSQVRWLAGDGSDRRYYRLAEAQGSALSYVLMELGPADALALAEGRYDWVTLAKEFARAGIRVPEIIATLPSAAGLLIEDFGDRTFEHQARLLIAQGDATGLAALYELAIRLIARFLSLPAGKGTLWSQRAFDHNKFVSELEFFRQKYLEDVAGIALSPQERRLFQGEIATLASYLTSLPTVCVHRDFHSRNLLMKGPELGVIDFQDARLGPASYDLVSLCFDSYVPLSCEKRLDILKLALDILGRALPLGERSQLAASWRPMLLQRQLKALGSFAYLSHEKRRGDYLQYAPAALATLTLCDDPRWPFLCRTIVGSYLPASLAKMGLG